MSLLKGRNYYKPFTYPQFYKRWDIHEKSHWLPSEVPMHEDVNDWKNRLNDNQRDFLTNIFRFFTQGDVDVASAYYTQYLKVNISLEKEKITLPQKRKNTLLQV